MGITLPKPNQLSPKHEDQVQEDEEEGEASTFTCEICIEPASLINRFKCNIKSSKHYYCVDCIAKYIEAKTEEYNMSEIKCPGLDCEGILDPLACRPTLPARVFERWCDVLCESAVLPCPKAYCPYADCSALILNECGGRVRKTNCPNCKKIFCFECKIPWHAGYRCSEAGEMRDRNDVLLGELLEEKHWKLCPACSHAVELSQGCPMVRCRCGTRFCYECGKKWCWCRKTMMFRLVPYTIGFGVVAIVMMFIILVFKCDKK